MTFNVFRNYGHLRIVIECKLREDEIIVYFRDFLESQEGFDVLLDLLQNLFFIAAIFLAHLIYERGMKYDTTESQIFTQCLLE